MIKSSATFKLLDRDVVGGLVDWTADVESHRRLFTEHESSYALLRSSAGAAADDSYWRTEADTFAAELQQAFPPSYTSLVLSPWGTHAVAEEAAEAGWVTTTSTARKTWEGDVADARKVERFTVAAALETRNNRLADVWADREITKAEGRLQTVRTTAYGDVVATLAGTRQQPLPRLTGCPAGTSSETPSVMDPGAECLPSFSSLNLDAVLADDYGLAELPPPPLNLMGCNGRIQNALPLQLGASLIHAARPLPPSSGYFLGSPSEPPQYQLSASLASRDFPQYYNRVTDLIFGNRYLETHRPLANFRNLGTAVDAIFQAYASSPTESFDHLLGTADTSGGTGSTSSGGSTLDGDYSRSPSPDSSGAGGTYGSTAESGGLLGGYGYSPTVTRGTSLAPDSGAFSGGSYGYDGGSSYIGSPTAGSYENDGGGSSDLTEPPAIDGDDADGGLARGDVDSSGTTIVLPLNHPLVRPQTEQSDVAIQDTVRETENKEWRKILGGSEGPLTPEQQDQLEAAVKEALEKIVIVVIVAEVHEAPNDLAADLSLPCQCSDRGGTPERPTLPEDVEQKGWFVRAGEFYVTKMTEQWFRAWLPPGVYDGAVFSLPEAERGWTVATNMASNGQGVVVGLVTVYGVIAGDLTGVTPLSDAFSRHDAVTGAAQSDAERILKGLLGGIQLGTTGFIGSRLAATYGFQGGPTVVPSFLSRLNPLSWVNTKLRGTRLCPYEAELVATRGAVTNFATSAPYQGVREASRYLRVSGVPRHIRKQILESFDRRAMHVRVAREAEYGIRYFDNVNAWSEGRYLFETFPANRQSLALRTDWNQMLYFKQWRLRPGTVILEGFAAPQGSYLPGGQVQVYVLKLADLMEP